MKLRPLSASAAKSRRPFCCERVLSRLNHQAPRVGTGLGERGIWNQRRRCPIDWRLPALGYACPKRPYVIRAWVSERLGLVVRIGVQSRSRYIHAAQMRRG